MRHMDYFEQAEEETRRFLNRPDMQFVVRAKQYLYAASILVQSERTIIKVPTLHLIAHGIEVLLKAPLVRASGDVEEVRKEFRHDIQKLWLADCNAEIRAKVFRIASLTWEEARASGKYRDAFAEKPDEAIECSLRDLSRLHSPETKFALKYIIPEGEIGPRAPHLVETFLEVADECLKNPSSF
ncbi:hypothetical protein [Nitrobacter winogradskyi]|nr:hypothetical protein [Nitrobacter winogradskyi]